jgi:hypothetical protein
MKVNLLSIDKKQSTFLYYSLNKNIVDCFDFVIKTITPKIEKRLKMLDYQIYPQTVYWKIVSQYKKNLIGK